MIKQVIVESGSGGTANAAGRIILKDVVGTFSDNESIHDDKTPLGNALANGTQSQTISSNCCFVMGGCPNDPMPRPYPPARLTPLPDRAHDMDPSLAYDLSDFGHLGYDPSLGAPDPDNSVQDQYTGTWEMYAPPDNDPRVGELLAKHVMNAITKPMVYLSNGEKAGITVGQSVTFTATVVTATRAVLGLRYESPGERFRFALAVTGAAPKRRVDPTRPDPLRLDGFVSVDCTAGWRVGDAWRVDAGVFNVGDASYLEWADVRGRPASDPILDLYRRPGRNWGLSVTGSW